MSNFRIRKDKKVIDAIAQGDSVTLKIENNDLRVGEMIDIDTEKIRVTGEVTWSFEDLIVMRMEKIVHKVVDA